MADNIALSKAAQMGNEILEIFLIDTTIGLGDLGYTTFEQAFKAGLITESEWAALSYEDWKESQGVKK